MRPLQRGDHVTIIQDGERLPAMVTLASPDGASVMLMFDGVIRTRSGGALLRMAPLLRRDDGTYVEIVEQTPVVLELDGHPSDNGRVVH